jgi:hypothetical protein
MRTLVIHPKDRTTDFLKPIYHGRDWTVITGGCTKEDVNKAIGEHDHIIMMGHGTPQGLLAMNQFNGKPKAKPAVKPSTAIRKAAGSGPVTSKTVKDFYTPSQTKGLLDGLPSEDDWYDDRKVGGGSYGGYGGYGSYGNSFTSMSSGYVIDDTTADLLRGKKLTAIWCNADQYMEWNDLEGFYTGMFVSDESEAQMIGCADTEKWQVDESNYAFAAIVRLLLNYPAEEMLKHLKLGYGKLANRNAIAKYNYRRLYVRRAKQAELVAVND